MLEIHPQYLKDADGKNTMVVLPVNEFDRMMEELEDAQDIWLFDESKNDNEPAISKNEAMAMIEAERKKIGK